MEALIGTVILPAIAGFLLIAGTPIYSFHVRKMAAERLTLWILAFALFLYMSFYFLIDFTQWLFPTSAAKQMLKWLIDEASSPFKHLFADNHQSDTASVLSFYFSIILIVYFRIWQLFQPDSFKNYTMGRKEDAITTMGERDALEDLLNYSIDNFEPIMVSLKNRKVYIGFVERLHKVFSMGERKHIDLFLLASGYRDSETLSFRLEHDYGFTLVKKLINDGEYKPDDMISLGHGEKVRADQLFKSLTQSTVIKTEEIVSANPWVESIYNVIQKQTVKQKKTK